tara:strand:- start:52 stop:438 length:387 start_codon:yes stop_codon:yes gene_type:complete
MNKLKLSSAEDVVQKKVLQDIYFHPSPKPPNQPYISSTFICSVYYDQKEKKKESWEEKKTKDDSEDGIRHMPVWDYLPRERSAGRLPVLPCLPAPATMSDRMGPTSVELANVPLTNTGTPGRKAGDGP